MKALLFVVSLAAVLIALPASAQLGPAGVPGAPGLAETDPSVKSSASVSPSTPQAKHTQQKRRPRQSAAKTKKRRSAKGEKWLKRQTTHARAKPAKNISNADKSKLGKKNAENQPTRHAVSSTKKQLSFARTNLARNTVSVCTRTSCRRIDQQETALLDKA